MANFICSRESLRVGFFIAWRQIKRTSVWTTGLIVLVMVFTFLNLVVASGVLVGLIEGAGKTFRQQYSGDIIIANYKSKSSIERTQEIVSILKNFPEVDAVTVRYLEGGVIESGYKERAGQLKEEPDSVATSIAGINPEDEDALSGLGSMVVEGEYLKPEDQNYILLGSFLLKKYLEINSPNFPLLERAEVGDKVRIKVGGINKEYTVKGIVKTKVDEVSRRAFLVDSELRKITGRGDLNANEIVVRLKPGVSADAEKTALLKSGIEQYGFVQTWQEAQGKFFDDIKNTMNLLGTVISSIGLVVASITIFIVIFINAVNRRKYIGILKGIGISGNALEVAYVLQSIFYAFFGTVIGLILTYGVLVPYFERNPINFPFSDGILVAPADTTAIRVLLLFLTNLIAGYIPARIIVKQKTLDAILGR